MSNKLLSILISTVDDNILENQNLLNINTEKVDVIIVQQLINSDKVLSIEKEGYKIISVKEKGLSRSRNLAMENARTPYAIYCDDDIIYTEDYYDRIFAAVEKYPEIDIFNFRIALTTGGFFKNYAEESYIHNLRTLLKVSSVEYVINVDKLKRSYIDQDVCFGLGSFYDQGENNIFLTDLNKNGFKAMYIPETLVIHPPENSGWDFSNRRLFSKGAVFTRIFGFKGVFYSTAFAFLKYADYKKQNNILSAMWNLWKGSFHYLIIGKSKKC